MRVFLEANILFSACLLAAGNAPRLIEVGGASGCVLLSSAHALGEAECNLVRKVPTALDRLVALTELLEVVPEVTEGDLLLWAEARGLPPKDAPILAAAILARADLLITGDRRHFGPLFGATLHGVQIAGLAEGLAMVLAAAESEA